MRASRPRLLLIDGDVVSAKVLSGRLVRAGFHVRWEPDDAAAIHDLQSGSATDVVLRVCRHHALSVERLADLRQALPADVAVIVLRLGRDVPAPGDAAPSSGIRLLATESFREILTALRRALATRDSFTGSR